MSKANRPGDDELQPGYDFASMKGGVRGKYVARLKKSANLVQLEPDVAEAFPSRGRGQRGPSGRSEHHASRRREGRAAEQGIAAEGPRQQAKSSA